MAGEVGPHLHRARSHRRPRRGGRVPSPDHPRSGRRHSTPTSGRARRAAGAVRTPRRDERAARRPRRSRRRSLHDRAPVRRAQPSSGRPHAPTISTEDHTLGERVAAQTIGTVHAGRTLSDRVQPLDVGQMRLGLDADAAHRVVRGGRDLHRHTRDVQHRQVNELPVHTRKPAEHQLAAQLRDVEQHPAVAPCRAPRRSPYRSPALPGREPRARAAPGS